MKDELKIKVFEPKTVEDNKLKKIKHLDKLLKPPFRLSVVGSTGAGKTNFIKNMIFEFYKNYFDEFYFFLGSKDEQVIFEELSRKHIVKKKRKKKKKKKTGIEPEDYFKSQTKKEEDEPEDDYDEKIKIISYFDDNEIMELFNDIEEDAEEARENGECPPRVLMVFDDMIFSNISNRHKLNSLDRLFMNGRHANISVIIASQKYTSLNQSCRCINPSMIVLYGLNDKELKVCSEEHSNKMEPKTFINMYKKETSKPYSFLAVNYQKPPDKRFYNSKFNEVLF